MLQPSTPNQFRHVGRFILLGFLGLATAAFVALGIWQIERLGWKNDLIARVTDRVHSPAVAAPGPKEWSAINRQNDEYRHVKVYGHFDHSRETLVYASTALGAGYWVLTPFNSEDGIRLINRGFVPLDRKEPASRAAGQLEGDLTLSGLLRLDEPDGTLLRSNNSLQDRWYSRDINAIAAKRGIAPSVLAPYFIDIDKTEVPGGYPIGGMTQVTFPNNHLQYALTWFAMAVMSSGFLVFLLREKRRHR
ncbi:SURF1 family protein [Allorhizobium undicola]|uniref:SURF1 family protein n=1 Tax=Allorhizobium undicola TaxID=78527 RepID=UPI003D330AF5